jgi:hypothetical protein
VKSNYVARKTNGANNENGTGDFFSITINCTLLSKKTIHGVIVSNDMHCSPTRLFLILKTLCLEAHSTEHNH